MTISRKTALVSSLIACVLLLAGGFLWVFLVGLAPSSEPDTPDSGPPRPPGRPGVLLAVPGNGRVLLAWTPPEADGGSPILGYTIYSGSLPGFLVPQALTGNTLFFTDIQLVNSHVYVYQVAAYNIVGSSDLSEVAIAVPGAFESSLFAVPRFGSAPLNVEFILSAPSPALRTLGTSVWDFGDSTTVSIQESGAILPRAHNISHTYRVPGAYMVSTSYGEDGGPFPGPKMPIVVLPPLVLEAEAGRTAGTAPFTVSFRATAAGGLPSQVITWDFGDGTGNETSNPEHTFTEAGTYTVNVTARDAAGNEARKSFEIRVMAPFSWGVLVDFGWVVAVLIAVGASGFVLGRLYEARRRTPRQ